MKIAKWGVIESTLDVGKRKNNSLITVWDATNGYRCALNRLRFNVTLLRTSAVPLRQRIILQLSPCYYYPPLLVRPDILRSSLGNKRTANYLNINEDSGARGNRIHPWGWKKEEEKNNWLITVRDATNGYRGALNRLRFNVALLCTSVAPLRQSVIVLLPLSLSYYYFPLLVRPDILRASPWNEGEPRIV